MSRLKLHLDADTSVRSLQQALLDRGYDVTRTPCEWMLADATDEEQLLGATAQGRCLFTFNIRDFTALAAVHPRHGGIILAAQRRWTLSELIDALDRVLSNGGRRRPGRAGPLAERLALRLRTKVQRGARRATAVDRVKEGELMGPQEDVDSHFGFVVERDSVLDLDRRRREQFRLPAR